MTNRGVIQRSQKECKMKKLSGLSILKKKDGVTAIVVGISLVVLVGFAALAIDIGHLCVARNELQNAADAGALAGAAVLYNDAGTVVNTGANQVACDMATANNSEGVAVDVNWTSGNEGDVQRGHWCFGIDKADGDELERGFYANDATAAVVLWGVSTKELDQNEDFINAVRVVARRQATPVASFFARIFGHESFELSQEAIAYRGFAGTLNPHDVDQPLAICQDTILENGEYNCNIGRMINSGQSEESNETGGWTSFSQDDPCTGGTNAQEVKDLVCGDGNPEMIQLGGDVATIGGETGALSLLIDCWEAKTDKTEPWNLTLPVVTCPGNNMGTCEEIVGAVNLNIVWINGDGIPEAENQKYKSAPTSMGAVPGMEEGNYTYTEWSCPADADNTNGQERWDSFVDHFNLQNVNGDSAPFANRSIYFLPDCTPHDPAGVSGGENFGILAKIPVLVK